MNATRQYFDYRPRTQFRAFHRRKERFACIITRRRAGKTVACIQYADMDPRVWPEIIRPCLSDREGWAVFIGTERPQFLVQDLAAVVHATRLVLADAERLRKRAAPETRAV